MKDDTPHIPRSAPDADSGHGQKAVGGRGGEEDSEEYDDDDDSAPSAPPESTFVKLGPSKNRYTILRDEF